jgi:hypothetical protein
MITSSIRDDQSADAKHPPVVRPRNQTTPIISVLIVVELWLTGLVGWRGLFYPASNPATESPIIGAALSSDPVQLTMAFVPNEGQLPEKVAFQARAIGGKLSFAAQKVYFDLPQGEMELQFEGGNSELVIEGRKLLPGVVNFYGSKDPAQWRENIPTYGQILYAQLYPGIDLLYEGSDSGFKRTFRIAPDGDPSQIVWQYSGAAGVAIDSNSGDLHIQLTDGRWSAAKWLVELAPVAWQNSPTGRIPVEAAYTISEDGVISFNFGVYDPRLPLVIDRYWIGFGG